MKFLLRIVVVLALLRSSAPATLPPPSESAGASSMHYIVEPEPFKKNIDYVFVKTLASTMHGRYALQSDPIENPDPDPPKDPTVEVLVLTYHNYDPNGSRRLELQSKLHKKVLCEEGVPIDASASQLLAIMNRFAEEMRNHDHDEHGKKAQ